MCIISGSIADEWHDVFANGVKAVSDAVMEVDFVGFLASKKVVSKSVEVFAAGATSG